MRIVILALLCFVQTSDIFSQSNLIDANASNLTKALLNNLKKTLKKGVIIGHQNDLIYGVNNENNEVSNIKNLSGSYPALFGWDLGLIEKEKDKNIESIPFVALINSIKYVYSIGGINTVSWHCNNPVDPNRMARTIKPGDSTLHKLFSDSVYLNRYISWLDKLAAFFDKLRASNGEYIPIIFRPFHESNGNWFWWGNKQGSAKEYIRLWRFTVDYLINKKHVHNLIYAFSPDRFDTKSDYLERYPGDKYADILGFDFYDNQKMDSDSTNLFTRRAITMVGILNDIATEKNKIIAFTETGFKKMPIKKWWTNSLLPIIKNSNLSYVMLWGYYSLDNYYDTFPGQLSADNFKQFIRDPNIFLLNYWATNKNFFYK